MEKKKKSNAAICVSHLLLKRPIFFQIKDGLLDLRQKLKVGDVRDFTVFTGAVIDATAFKRISGYIDYARKSSKMEIIGGGHCDDSYVFEMCLPSLIVIINAYCFLKRELSFSVADTSSNRQ